MELMELEDESLQDERLPYTFLIRDEEIKGTLNTFLEERKVRALCMT